MNLVAQVVNWRQDTIQLQVGEGISLFATVSEPTLWPQSVAGAIYPAFEVARTEIDHSPPPVRQW